MKKLHILLGAGALLLTACSQDTLVEPNAPNGGNENQAPIAFQMTSANQGRADADKQLESEAYEFGVWAYKGATDMANTVSKATAASTVMENYLVGFWDGTNGYKPLVGQDQFVDWIYEGLGKTQKDTEYEYVAKGTETGVESVNDNQYLKYWDWSTASTYFFACVPYNSATFAKADQSLTFPAITETTGANYMFAVNRVPSKGTDQVPLRFYRLASQINVAFYTDLKGYSVELTNLQGDDANIYFQAATKSGSTYTKTSYVSGATPKVTFAEDATTKALSWNVTFTSPTNATAPFTCPIDYFTRPDASPAITGYTKALGEARTDLLVGPVKTVVPVDASLVAAGTNPGFTVTASFKLTAKDTKEEIIVTGAKVHVEATHCAWLPNHKYTYVFRITKNINGTTEGGNPDPTDPTPGNKALYPIIFNDVEVADYLDNAHQLPSDTGAFDF